MTVRSLRAAAVLVAMAPLSLLLPTVAAWESATTTTWERCYAAPKPSGTKGISLRDHTSLLPATALRGRSGF